MHQFSIGCCFASISLLIGYFFQKDALSFQGVYEKQKSKMQYVWYKHGKTQQIRLGLKGIRINAPIIAFATCAVYGSILYPITNCNASGIISNISPVPIMGVQSVLLPVTFYAYYRTKFGKTPKLQRRIRIRQMFSAQGLFFNFGVKFSLMSMFALLYSVITPWSLNLMIFEAKCFIRENSVIEPTTGECFFFRRTLKHFSGAEEELEKLGQLCQLEDYRRKINPSLLKLLFYNYESEDTDSNYWKYNPKGKTLNPRVERSSPCL